MADLNLKVKVITDGLSKLNGLNSGFAGFAKGAVVAGGALAGVGIAAGAAFAGMASDAEDADAKLANTFKTMKAGAFTSIPALNAQAEALAKATTFDDEGIKDAQATLLTFGQVTGKTFDRALVASTDLAAFFETDATTAALTLGKALNDPLKGLTKLQRQGISFTEAQQEQVAAMVEAGDVAGAQAVILGELEKQVGGTATTLSETSGGQMAQAMEDLGEAAEAIGVLILPIFVKIAQALAGLAEFVTANMPIIQSVIGTVMTAISGFFNNASGPVSGVTALFQRIVDFWIVQGPTIMSIVGQVFGAIANVIKSVWPIIERVATFLFPIVATAAGVLFTALDIAFKGIGGAFEVLGNVFTTVADIITGVVSGVVGAFKAIYNAFAGFWNSIQLDFPSLDIPFFGKIGGFSIGLPDIPLLASGGIVTKPTLAVIGERGPEAVVPLGRGLTGSVVNNFNFPGPLVPPDERQLIERVERSQRLTRSLAWNN